MLEIHVRRVRSVAVLDLSGDIDIDASVLVEKVGWCLDNRYRAVLCNFESVGNVDFTGLSAIGLAYKNCVNHSARMKMVNVPVHVRKRFELVCLDRVFEFFGDEKTAVASFEEDEAISAIKKKQLRRRFRRLPLDIGIELKAKNEAEYHKAKALNLSAVGVLVFIDKAYPLGTVLDLRISLKPIADSLLLEAVVSWLVDKKIQPQIYPGMGLEFRHLDTLTQEHIAEFVERNLPLDSCA